ncbi:unnamed protein product, partial [Brenthis ino]
MRLSLFPQNIRGSRRFYHDLPFIHLYKDVTGETISEYFALELQKKNHKIKNLSREQLLNTLQVLSKFGINAKDACLNPHIFCMNLISMDNYGEILKECNFTVILPKHIIRYHTLVKSRTISQLKKDGLLKDNLNLEELLYNYFHDWPREYIHFLNFPDSNTNILTVRLSILERYLQWKFSISSEEFKKYCKNYLPLKHRPMCDIQEALNIAQNDIKFDTESIRRNGFIISSDPVNTKLILENVDSLGGLDIRTAIKIEPAILKNHYQALLDIKNILEQYNISNEAQRSCFKVYCMRPETVRARLEHLTNLKEYRVLSSNPRVLYLVVHEKKMMTRLSKIQAARKQCFSLNHLVASSKVFNTYINSFGNKVCGRDMAILISSSLQTKEISNKSVLKKMKKHKYWLYTALNVIGENIKLLKKQFSDDVIFNNCHLLLYPGFELEQYIEILLKIRDGGTPTESSRDIDIMYRNLNCHILTDNQILSLVLYEIEKKYHFSGDGVWNKSDGKGTWSHQTKGNVIN